MATMVRDMARSSRILEDHGWDCAPDVARGLKSSTSTSCKPDDPGDFVTQRHRQRPIAAGAPNRARRSKPLPGASVGSAAGYPELWARRACESSGLVQVGDVRFADPYLCLLDRLRF